MKKVVLAAMVLCMLGAPVLGQTDTSKMLSSIHSKAAGALATLQFTVENQAGSRTFGGQAVCIDKTGVFMTLSIDARINTDMIKDLELTPPGEDATAIKAELLGIDALAGLGFVKATEPHEWQVVKFVKAADLKIGQAVGSIGLLRGQPYLGAGYVSTTMRVPEQLAYVTGGSLTGPASPVFNAQGKAIGLVGKQLFQNYQIMGRQGAQAMNIRGLSQTSFFMPVDEFVAVLQNIPSTGKVTKLPWIGVNRFESVTEDFAEILKLDKPGVMIDQVIEGQPADKAGLKDRDIIVALDGKGLEELETPNMTVQAFVRRLMSKKPGAKVALTVLSGQKTKQVEVELAEMPTLPNQAPRTFAPAYGLLVREKVMLDQYLDDSPTAAVSGLVVLGVLRGSSAAQQGVQAGDVITEVNDQAVKTVEFFKNVTDKAQKDKAPLVVQIRRGNQGRTITLQPMQPQPRRTNRQ